MDTMRITGMASGMDIEGTVRDLMQAERQPLVDMQQEQKETELKMDEYREVNRDLMKFHDDMFENILMPSAMTAKEVQSSNESLVSAEASSSAAEGTYTFEDVELASSETNVSAAPVYAEGSGSDDFDLHAPLSEMAEHLTGEVGETFDVELTTFSDDGEAVEFAESYDAATASMNDVLEDINASEIGAQAFFDENSGQLSVTREETGVRNPDGGAEVLFGEGNFMTDVLNMDEANANEARDASFTMNGMETTRRDNSFEIDGMTVSLNDGFENQQVAVEVGTDTEDIFDNIMSFVEDYNELINELDDKTNEEYHRDYKPLTEEQMQEMDEREIEMWNEQAESGLLRNDDVIGRGLTSMRSDMYGEFTPDDENQAFNMLPDIGITTGDWENRGELQVDEDELRAAIEEDSESVYNLFAANGEGEERGIARRVRDSVDNTMNSIAERAGNPDMPVTENSTLGREISNQNDRIINFERRMQQVEDRYWSEFNEMERAMNEANAQMQQLQSQMGGMM
ncbi:flagellar filament capping protein FliD [Salisediminibacterium halotolerans]|uniref:Flagellar hook-associated protein 2 n=1 Tax=Salisediminibacterium halotolerans TaxID=517425 RepID=A0A1H9VIR6_9BACI|nr:flagellar filament capping protein FliD [Salisediminibacterium haloalkalitolerans]SES21680.1 flagellar hook-associated protein 2 [Salisediminibacterium haloalkalitolerans]